jgi:transposase
MKIRDTLGPIFEDEQFSEMYPTIGQAANDKGARRARYRGLERTHLQHLATAAAINLERVARWLMGERPEATRISPFAVLASPI